MKCYKIKYRLGITHSVDNNEKNKHNHILEGEIFAKPSDDDFVEFSDMENMVNETLEEYKNIENVGEVFWKKLFMVFEKNGWALIRLEIGENPLRIYSVSTEEIRM